MQLEAGYGCLFRRQYLKHRGRYVYGDFIVSKHKKFTAAYRCISCHVVGLAILRCIFTIYGAFDDPEMTLKQALQRSKKTIIRTVIVICASSFVSWVNSFYK